MKAKKILFSILSALCLGFSSFSLASCGEKSHVHEWDEGEIINNATCTEGGLIAFKCKTCEETKVDVISALGHTEVIDDAVAATCTSTGLTEGKHCSVCNEVLVAQETIEINPENHVYNNYVCSECDYNYYTEGLEFILSDEYYAITDYHGTSTNVVIPSVYNDKPVTSIRSYAFFGCFYLTNITIPDSVTNIGEWAFLGCSSLTSITIPDSVTSICYWTFASCSSLTSIVIPDNVTSIDVGAFLDCSSLTTVYYEGTKEQWNSINIDGGNESLTNATIIYNYVPEEEN